MADIMNRHNVCYHSYTDDCQVYIVCDNDEYSINQGVKQLEDCITDVCKWMRNSSLKIEQDKTDFTISRTIGVSRISFRGGGVQNFSGKVGVFAWCEVPCMQRVAKPRVC